MWLVELYKSGGAFILTDSKDRASSSSRSALHKVGLIARMRVSSNSESLATCFCDIMDRKAAHAAFSAPEYGKKGGHTTSLAMYRTDGVLSIGCICFGQWLGSHWETGMKLPFS